MIKIQNCNFILSAASPADFRRDLTQVAFAGRSNVGKSSLINRLCQRRNLARVGNSPGKTAHVNYFLVDDWFYLVDLPGYGYAKVSKAERERWGKLMEAFFNEKITLGVHIVDARHKPTADDVTMAGYFQQTCVPVIVVANKVDKLKKSEIEPSLAVIRQTLVLDDSVPLIPFSAEKGAGREELLFEIEKRLPERG